MKNIPNKFSLERKTIQRWEVNNLYEYIDLLGNPFVGWLVGYEFNGKPLIM
jgi:hypothetical protein